MKNIFIALAFAVTLGATAQTKKATVATTQTVTIQKLNPDQSAERDMAALAKVVTVDENVKADVNKIFITKYRAKEDTNLSTERLAALSSFVESSLLNFLGENNFSKLKANTKLYDQLVK